MTPLAHRIVKEMTMPLKRRSLDDRADILSKMDDVHCFEVSAVDDLALDMGRRYASNGVIDRITSFLPAPRTWIELGAGGYRMGWLLESHSEDSARVYTVVRGDGHFVANYSKLLLFGTLDQPLYRSPLGAEEYYRLLGLLAIINTPRIIGRRQHMPHSGLERKLVAQRPMVGKFPLHAWTEIELRVTPPRDASGEAVHEAHLTGERALHFCRAHLRIRLGRLEIVKAHWRGDPSLGIRQSRYKLAA